MRYPIRTIVAGVAALDEHDPVLGPALELAERLGARLHLVHAFELPDIVWDAYAQMGYMDVEAHTRHAAALQERLERSVRQATDNPRVACHVVSGAPGTAIHELADRENAELILVGTTRRGALASKVLGSTAQRVLRGGRVPVLVVKEPLRAELGRVLLTTDLSEFSAGVQEIGLDVVESLFGTARPALRSLLVLWYGATLPPPLREDLLRKLAEDQITSFLAERRARERPVVPAVRTGDPAREILAEAKEWEPDLIVIGSHARKGAQRFLLGSVAEEVLRTAPTSVLVVPAVTTEQMTLPVKLEREGVPQLQAD
jgi:universal stress protein E